MHHPPRHSRRQLVDLAGIDRLTLEEIRAELDRLVERRFALSRLSRVDEAHYRVLAFRERAFRFAAV